MKKKLTLVTCLLAVLVVSTLFLTKTVMYIGTEEDVVEYINDEISFPPVEEGDIYYLQNQSNRWMALYNNTAYRGYYSFLSLKRVVGPFYKREFVADNNRDDGGVKSFGFASSGSAPHEFFWWKDLDRSKIYVLNEVDRDSDKTKKTTLTKLEPTAVMVERSEDADYFIATYDSKEEAERSNMQ
ncbi:MAG: hypothetical protein SPI65_03920 [Peptoniphilus sp.]|nr:hypothetical protein [Peptoniphilus sp.]MDD7363643.1 hypothetical protein [Bacillota bacterium]MDY6044711.1 hypothetical protein [Peptoniphilus sp.]